MVLTHAHLDHCGLLPRLVPRDTRAVLRSRGRSSCAAWSSPTQGGSRKRTQAANKYGYYKHTPAHRWFTENDAQRALTLLQPAVTARRSTWARNSRSSSPAATCSARPTSAAQTAADILFRRATRSFGRPCCRIRTRSIMPTCCRQSRLRRPAAPARRRRRAAGRGDRTPSIRRGKVIIRRSRSGARGGPLLGEAARGKRAASRWCRSTWTARWRTRRSILRPAARRAGRRDETAAGAPAMFATSASPGPDRHRNRSRSPPRSCRRS